MASKISKEGLVAMAIGKLRAIIVAQEPDRLIGSLPSLAKDLGVGLVTIQQAARVLEHEGYLKVRRGNSGGYYGSRPDAAALGRAMAGFLQIDRSHEQEAIKIMTLLDCDLMPAAALSTDEGLRNRLQELDRLIDDRDTPDQRGTFEEDMQEILYKMVDRPLMEMLARVTMQHAATSSHIPIYTGAEGIARWKRERHNIIDAILRRDPALARFEAERRREDILQRLALSC